MAVSDAASDAMAQQALREQQQLEGQLASTGGSVANGEAGGGGGGSMADSGSWGVVSAGGTASSVAAAGPDPSHTATGAMPGTPVHGLFAAEPTADQSEPTIASDTASDDSEEDPMGTFLRRVHRRSQAQAAHTDRASQVYETTTFGGNPLRDPRRTASPLGARQGQTAGSSGGTTGEAPAR